MHFGVATKLLITHDCLLFFSKSFHSFYSRGARLSKHADRLLAIIQKELERDEGERKREMDIHVTTIKSKTNFYEYYTSLMDV